MYGSAYLPAGASFCSNAPWNDVDPVYIDFSAECIVYTWSDEIEDFTASTIDVNVSVPTEKPLDEYGFREIEMLVCDSLAEALKDYDDWQLIDYCEI